MPAIRRNAEQTQEKARADGPYVGRFAPSPTGPLHAGSLATALASRLDALAHGGRWLLRMEDLDPPREAAGATESILTCLEVLGFRSDGPVVFQSARHDVYRQAFDRLVAAGHVYPCGCTRREIEDSVIGLGGLRRPDSELVYAGTCRGGLPPQRGVRSWRLDVGKAVIAWRDRSGREFEDVLASQIGDFVLRRADGLWAYQLAVVVDDGEQGITDVVRGDDLIGSTSRQILLQQLLGLERPRYLHLPIVPGADGRKLSKQNGARPIDVGAPIESLNAAMRHLGLPAIECTDLTEFWRHATQAWRRSHWMAPARKETIR